MNDRQEAIEELKNTALYRYAEITGKWDKKATAIKLAIEVLSQPPADQWISCSRELPKDGQHIIATFESNIGARQVTEEHFHKSFLQEPWKMIAWYPFPQPYKGVE